MLYYKDEVIMQCYAIVSYRLILSCYIKLRHFMLCYKL
jgi:hypothetical protein